MDLPGVPGHQGLRSGDVKKIHGTGRIPFPDLSLSDIYSAIAQFEINNFSEFY
jgi:hypothetical protein